MRRVDLSSTTGLSVTHVDYDLDSDVFELVCKKPGARREDRIRVLAAGLRRYMVTQSPPAGPFQSGLLEEGVRIESALLDGRSGGGRVTLTLAGARSLLIEFEFTTLDVRQYGTGT